MSIIHRFRIASGRHLRSAMLVPGLALVVAAAISPAQFAHAQAAQPRTVDGKVVADGQPVKGAVVHLKDTRTLSQKSYITAADGTYRFAQLSSTSDYEIWAESSGKKSSTKTISSFDTKPNYNYVLKIE